MNIEGPKAEADTAKQIITLSTGALAFTVTFLEKINAPAATLAPNALYVSWLLFGLTIALALWYLVAQNGTIDAIARKENGWEMSEDQERAANGGRDHVKAPAMLMYGCFFCAVITLIASGIFR